MIHTTCTRCGHVHARGACRLKPIAAHQADNISRKHEQDARHIRKLDRQTLHILTVLERIENPVHRQLLCNVYMDGMSIKRACFEVDRKPGNHYSYDWMRHLHRNALLSYGKALDNA